MKFEGQEAISLVPKREAGAGTVERVCALLTEIAESNGDVSIQSISAATALAPSTVHRLLDLLSREGFVDRVAEVKRYRIGPALFRLAGLVVSQLDIAAVATPGMERLVRASGETAILGLYDASSRSMYFVHRLQSPNTLGYNIDMAARYPLLWGATSKAILAFLDDDTIEEIRKQAATSPASSRRVPTRKDLFTELHEIRERGYSHTRSEKMVGAVGVAVPVFGQRGKVWGCLGLTIPEFRATETAIKRFVPLIQREAAALSALLGCGRS